MTDPVRTDTDASIRAPRPIDPPGPGGSPADPLHPASALDNAVAAALAGPHAHLAQRHGAAARYPADVAPFAAIPDRPEPGAWADLAALVGPGGEAVLFRGEILVPEGWQVLMRGEGVQMVSAGVEGRDDGDAVPLGVDDAEEMLALVARTRPGPFLRRTPHMGTYIGIRDSKGSLVSMAGERLHLQGWTEISAVCTDPGFRGRGLGTRLVRSLVAGILARGETPFLHAAASNTAAIRLYGAMGFARRRDVIFARLRAPLTSEVHSPR